MTDETAAPTPHPETEVDAALVAVARDMVRVAVRRAIDDATIGWEDWPDLSEQDYDRALAMATNLAETMRSPTDTYEAAYRLLARRAEGM